MDANVYRWPIWFVLGGSLLALVACGTPAAVNDLAKQTSDNVVQFGVSLESFASATRADAERRATNVGRQTTIIERETLRHERSIALAEKAGRTAPKQLYDDIKSLADEWAQKEAERANAGATVRQELIDSQATLETQASALRGIGGQLLVLSKPSSRSSRVTFLVGFTKDVARELREAREAAGETDASDGESEE